MQQSRLATATRPATGSAFERRVAAPPLGAQQPQQEGPSLELLSGETAYFACACETRQAGGARRATRGAPARALQLHARDCRNNRRNKRQTPADGSNMSPAVLTGRRRVRPRVSAPAVAPSQRLSFGMVGLPFAEPAFATLLPPGHALVAGGAPPAHGVVHVVSGEEWAQICRSEGVGARGVGYQVIEVELQLYGTGRGRGGSSGGGGPDWGGVVRALTLQVWGCTARARVLRTASRRVRSGALIAASRLRACRLPLALPAAGPPPDPQGNPPSPARPARARTRRSTAAPAARCPRGATWTSCAAVRAGASMGGEGRGLRAPRREAAGARAAQPAACGCTTWQLQVRCTRAAQARVAGQATVLRAPPPRACNSGT
jgi:hypothetical protein